MRISVLTLQKAVFRADEHWVGNCNDLFTSPSLRDPRNYDPTLMAARRRCAAASGRCMKPDR